MASYFGIIGQRRNIYIYIYYMYAFVDTVNLSFQRKVNTEMPENLHQLQRQSRIFPSVSIENKLNLGPSPLGNILEEETQHSK